MSYHKERRLVLELLETGKITLDQANRLLDLLSMPASISTCEDTPQESLKKIYFEIDADQKNLQLVLDKLNKAFS
ncbi:MAG TPA: hypothetical protein DCY42_01315 [Chloroflexi bacterium]|nr:hypothetical protein [Chloroflexota bacterium]